MTIKKDTPKTFKCKICAAEVEALPTGYTTIMGGTLFVYKTPQGWWSITTSEGMQLFCDDEMVTIEGGEVLWGRTISPWAGVP